MTKNLTVFAVAYAVTFFTYWLGLEMYWKHERLSQRNEWPERDWKLRFGVSVTLAASIVLAFACAVVSIVVLVRAAWTHA